MHKPATNAKYDVFTICIWFIWRGKVDEENRDAESIKKYPVNQWQRISRSITYKTNLSTKRPPHKFLWGGLYYWIPNSL